MQNVLVCTGPGMDNKAAFMTLDEVKGGIFVLLFSMIKPFDVSNN